MLKPEWMVSDECPQQFECTTPSLPTNKPRQLVGIIWTLWSHLIDGNKLSLFSVRLLLLLVSCLIGPILIELVGVSCILEIFQRNCMVLFIWMYRQFPISDIREFLFHCWFYTMLSYFICLSYIFVLEEVWFMSSSLCFMLYFMINNSDHGPA